MNTNATQLNATTLDIEFTWFSEVLNTRIQLYFEKGCAYSSIFEVAIPDLKENKSSYASIIRHFQLTPPERLVLLMALAPHFSPSLLDIFFSKNTTFDRAYSEFGGVVDKKHTGFLPTGETAMFLLAGGDLLTRFTYQNLFEKEHLFHKFNILQLNTETEQEPPLSGALTVSEEFLTYFSTGTEYRPK